MLGLYLPAAHYVQLGAPAALQPPTPHVLHTDTPALLYVPAAHAKHDNADDWPVIELYVPATQLVHIVNPVVAPYIPIGQGKQAEPPVDP
jgi:hypothetical protein